MVPDLVTAAARRIEPFRSVDLHRVRDMAVQVERGREVEWSGSTYLLLVAVPVVWP